MIGIVNTWVGQRERRLMPRSAARELRNGETDFGRVHELPTRFRFGRDGTLVLAFSGVAEPKKLITAVGKVVESPSPGR